MAVGARRALPLPRAIARSDAALPLGLLAPTLIFLGLLILLPVAQAVLLSFKAADGTLGLDAYERMFSDVAFADAFRNTILLIVAIVPLQMVLALAMALLINSLLSAFGLVKEPIQYLSYENLQYVFLAVVAAESWRATAIVLVILLAGLQLIPRDYFEAAEVFGASRL